MNPEKLNFLDIRGHDFVRVAAISPVVHRANPIACATEHFEWVLRAYGQGAQLIVAPELGLSGGYTLQDLHHDKTKIEKTDAAIAWFLEQTSDINALVAFGASLKVGGLFFNGLFVTLRGKVQGIIIKTAPPNNDEFTEGRWFRGAAELPQDTIFKFGQQIPIGDDLLFCSQDNPDLILAGEVCEDSWLGITPGALLAYQGALVIFSCHGSNYQLTKPQWRRHIALRSGDNLSAYIYASTGYGESSTGLVFDGHCLVSDRGEILKENKLFEPYGSLIVQDINFGALIADRMRSNSWSIAARKFREVFPARRIYFDGLLGCKDTTTYHHFEREFDREPFVPKTDEEKWEVFMARVMGLRTRFAHLPKHLRKVVIGLSGGKDSTSILMLVKRLIELFGDELEMTEKDIFCITMPGFGTSQDTYDFAQALATELGVTFIEQPITELAQLMFKAVGHPNLEQEVEDLPKGSPLTLLFENTQVFVRKLVEMTQTSAVGGVDIGSTSASEAFIGWFTLFGDGSSHYAPNAGMGKSAVPAELEWLARTIYADKPVLSDLLVAIARSASSPELLKMQDGQVVQKSEEINGPDSVRDFFAYAFLRFHLQPATIYRIAIEAYAETYTPADLYRWLRRFITRFFTNWYKMNMQSIDTVKIGIAPGAHDFWKMGSDISPEIWLENLDEIPEEYRS